HRVEPVRACGIGGLKQGRDCILAGAQVMPDAALALRLREVAERQDVVHLDPVDVVLRRRVDHPERRVRVGLAVDVRDAPPVADDLDALGLLLPAPDLLRSERLGSQWRCGGKQHDAERGSAEQSHDGRRSNGFPECGATYGWRAGGFKSGAQCRPAQLHCETAIMTSQTPGISLLQRRSIRSDARAPTYWRQAVPYIILAPGRHLARRQ